ncbi:hypothetical protein D9613_002389 [Agrocybe pediades]|uniref:F-box domain-containing protein n=1 Tax=Agrocybe pediades TaxID=84607 RepID=A0A8H4VVM4_9AGAR|nr:hypothetical protein D9613_002389 [Agrocybe pediades]
MNTLPPEIHGHVASFIHHPPDLARLCLVSRYWISIARPFLYHTLILRSDTRYPNDTLDLLTRDYELAKAIHSFTIITRGRLSDDFQAGLPALAVLVPGAWIKLADLAGLDNLRRFKIDGIPSMPADQFQQIFADLFRMAKNLEEVECIDTTFTTDSQWWSLGMRKREFYPFSDVPSTIKKVTYTAGYPIDVHRMLSTTFTHPYSSITELVVSTRQINEWSNVSTAKGLASLRFPELNTLRLVGGGTCVIPSSTPFLDFLAMHPMIRTLSIPNSEILLDSAIQRKDILPQLSSISIRANRVASASYIFCELPSVSYLELHNVSAFASLRDFCDFQGGFSKLKRCVIDSASGEVMNQILQFLKGALELEWLTMHTNSSTDADFIRLVHSLSRYPKLARVDFLQSGVNSEMLQRTAEQINSLQKIVLFDAHRMRLEVTAAYSVHRLPTESGGPVLKQTYVLPPGPPYLQDRRIIRLETFDWWEDTRLDGWSDCAHILSL